MSEPKVEFDLQGMVDEAVKLQFDQFREWFEFREDRGTPAIQTFQGELEDDQDVEHYVNGEVYGAVGFTQVLGAGNFKYWAPMTTSGAGRNYISANTGDASNNSVRVYGNSNFGTLKYTLTVFYRG